jgi:hypothetical protein
VRRTFNLTLAVAIALGVLAVPGCGDDADGGADESRDHARQAEPETASSDAGAAVLWPAPPDPLERTAAAGLEPGRKEFLIHHAHAQLDVFVDGKPIVVPGGIGINIDDPEVQQFEDPAGTVAYGGIMRCGKPCISPLHTHDATGMIHTEAKSPSPTRSASSSRSGECVSTSPALRNAAVPTGSRSTSTASPISTTRAPSS